MTLDEILEPRLPQVLERQLGTVGVDEDGDGFQESIVAGTLTWIDPMAGIAGGATIEITELSQNVVNMTATVMVTGPTQATFSDIVASVPAEGGRPDVFVMNGEITVDVSTSPPGLTGFVNFAVGDLDATMTLTTGGIVVDGDGFSFSVP